MTPYTLLSHYDSGQLWADAGSAPSRDVASAYRDALAVRELRIARGEAPAGYKIGFTNRGIWSRYNVAAPIWGTVWASTLSFCDKAGTVSLERCCQPRIEPEVAFGFRSAPPPEPSLQEIFECIDWMAPAFEVVQSHCVDWKFTAAETVADGGLHARLLVGTRIPIAEVASDAAGLERQLVEASVVLRRGDADVERGRGANVLDGPLSALRHFLLEMYQCAGAPGLQPGDVVTTGTWTDAWPVASGEVWQARFSPPLAPLQVTFT
jgi:2-oxo-3-hexenedioate decarboxylase